MGFGPHPFSLRQLQYVIAVADSLSFHRAADNCHVSQPSLSVQIAELERLLAIKIFERDPHRVALTAVGRDFVESARALLHAADALVETARRGIDPFSSTLRIGVIPTISPYWLPELTPALHKAYPQLTVIWTEDKTHMLVHALQSGAIDRCSAGAGSGNRRRRARSDRKRPICPGGSGGKSVGGEACARQSCRIARSTCNGPRGRTLFWQTGSGVLLPRRRGGSNNRPGVAQEIFTDTSFAQVGDQHDTSLSEDSKV